MDPILVGRPDLMAEPSKECTVKTPQPVTLCLLKVAHPGVQTHGYLSMHDPIEQMLPSATCYNAPNKQCARRDWSSIEESSQSRRANFPTWDQKWINARSADMWWTHHRSAAPCPWSCALCIKVPLCVKNNGKSYRSRIHQCYHWLGRTGLPLRLLSGSRSRSSC